MRKNLSITLLYVVFLDDPIEDNDPKIDPKTGKEIWDNLLVSGTDCAACPNCGGRDYKFYDLHVEIAKIRAAGKEKMYCNTCQKPFFLSLHIKDGPHQCVICKKGKGTVSCTYHVDEGILPGSSFSCHFCDGRTTVG